MAPTMTGSRAVKKKPLPFFLHAKVTGEIANRTFDSEQKMLNFGLG